MPNQTGTLKSHNITYKKQDIKPLLPALKWNENTKLAFACKLESEQTMLSIKEIEKLMEQDENIDVVVHKLTDIYNIKNPHEKQKKSKNIRKQQKKWYDKSCDELAKQLKLTAKLLSATPDSPFLRGSLFKKRKEYRKLIKLKKKEWKQNMIKKLEEIEEKDPKEYWQLISNLRGKKSIEANFDTEKFTEFFEKLYSIPKKEKENKKITEFVKKSLENIPESTFEPEFTIEELKTAIKHLKNKKAAGPDRIIAEMLKASTEPMMSIILKIMNRIKRTMQYPSNWAKGITSLLLKEGDDDNPNNYRAITVTDALAKVLAILLNERIGKWSDDNKILKVEQIGFEKKARPADHLFVLKTITDKYKNQGKKVYTCFIDFQKAFDSVWRTGLLYKLIKNGMNLSTIKLIKNMYERTSQSLKINGGISEEFRTYKGVRQGCILSPKLFNLFINDIPNIFDASCKPVNIHDDVSINCLMYADDLVILSESSAGLQACLHKLYNYTQKWELKLNITKTKIMIFQNKKSTKDLADQYIFGSQIIKHTDTYKYLGTIMTSTGNFKLNEINLKKKGLRASFVISKNLGEYAKPSTTIRLFEKIIEPILLYNCEITGACIPKTWNYEKFTKNMWEIGKELNTVIMGFLRQILGVHKKTTNIAILSETGKLPIAIKIYTYIMRYWNRIAVSEKVLLRAARETNEEMQEKNKPNWKKIVLFLLQVTNSTDTKNNNFEQQLERLYKEWWYKQTKITGSKLDFYYRYKKCFRYEKYLDNLPRHIRINTTKIRLSCHPFPVEVLRYSKSKILRKDRKCNICNSDEIGDEDHYLLRCKNAELNYIRENFMKNIREEIPQLKSFSNQNIIDYGLALSDERIQIPIATYIKQIITTYKEETGGKIDIPKSPVKTRVGRLVKKPTKLNL